MRKYNLLTATFLAFAFVACHDTPAGEKLFSFDEAKLKSQYKNGETATLQLLNPQNKSVDSVAYYVNDKRVASVKNLEKASYTLKDARLGYQPLKAIVFFDGDVSGQEITSRIEVVASADAKILKYKILNTYPHDVKSFTEGFEFFRDTLMESTGQKGASYFRKYDYKTGKIFKQVDMDPKYFGEGITAINNKIFELTWQEKTGFIFDANTLKKEKTFTFDKPIEGWGMTNDGKYIYQSDGTEKIWRMDPATQKMVDYVNVYTSDSKLKNVNELEYINGKIYANVWQKDVIVVIDAKTGTVEGVLDMSGLKAQVKNPEADVLNGIAYNPKTKTIFVTGKNWNKMFEIVVE
jgi:glutamine cyclotransferase